MLIKPKTIIIFAKLVQICVWVESAAALPNDAPKDLVRTAGVLEANSGRETDFDLNQIWSLPDLPKMTSDVPMLVVTPVSVTPDETSQNTNSAIDSDPALSTSVSQEAYTQKPEPDAARADQPAQQPSSEPASTPPSAASAPDEARLSPVSAQEASPTLDPSATSPNKPFGNKAKKSLAPPRKTTLSGTQQKAKRPNTGGNIPKGRTIIDLQRSSRSSTIALPGDDGTPGSATLIDLNPEFGAWYLLKIRFSEAGPEYGFNLESAYPDRIRIGLEAKYPNGVVILEGDKATPCPLFDKGHRAPLLDSLKSQNAFSSLCENKIFTRNKVDGRKTTKEWVSEFLRDNVWGGEEVTTFVKERFFKDKFLIAGDLEKAKTASKTQQNADKAPRAARIAPASREVLLPSTSLGLSIAGEDGNKKMVPGQWYELKTHDGIYVSSIETSLVDPEILAKHKTLVNRLDNTEDNAVIYLVAFDLSEFRMGFTMGTDHPRIDWSPRVIDEVRDRTSGGPDGIANWAPLITTGMINPVLHDEVVATFTGGFKRDHGAMRWGALAYKNKGTHYGFVENGVIFSRLNPGLATLFMTRSGQVEMRTWEESDGELETKLLFARQNGVPIIEWDNASQSGIPGKLVRQWGPGNWSGSEDSKLRTLRAGTCLLETDTRRFLVYGYFSSATPSAMAQAFHAYGCRYAMHMDMNALEHTYLAIYAREGKQLSVEHLINGMNVLDKQFKNQTVPRFIGFPDNRDFFYLYRKN